MSVIDQYLHFKVGNAECAIPYFNNKRIQSRGALRVYAGKGSPKEIFEEVRILAIKSHVKIEALTNESLKHLLADNNIGIDCSGFAYYVLNAESEERGKGPLDKHVHFVNCRGIIGKIRCSLRPIENCDVATLADDKNSRAISIREARVGDIITMMDADAGDSIQAQNNNNMSSKINSERNHILVIHQIEYQNFIPAKIHYSHAIAYPEDGLYGGRVRQGTIEIANPDVSIVDGRWIEDGMAGDQNKIFVRAKNAKTELRRIN